MRRSTPAPATEPEPSERRPRVLLAEDDVELRSLLGSLLTGAGYDVVECADGRAALTELRALLFDEPGRPIDVVVSDVRMPHLGGLDMLAWCGPLIGRVPVILMTAFSSPELRRDAAFLGVTAVLDKPFDVDDLLSEVRRVVKARTGE